MWLCQGCLAASRLFSFLLLFLVTCLIIVERNSKKEKSEQQQPAIHKLSTIFCWVEEGEKRIFFFALSLFLILVENWIFLFRNNVIYEYKRKKSRRLLHLYQLLFKVYFTLNIYILQIPVINISERLFFSCEKKIFCYYDRVGCFDLEKYLFVVIFGLNIWPMNK